MAIELKMKDKPTETPSNVLSKIPEGAKVQELTSKTFYCKVPNLIFYPGKSRRAMVDNELRVIDPDPIQFREMMGNSGKKVGQFIATTPEEIEACERRMTDPGDVMDTNQMLDYLATEEEKIKMRDNSVRELSQENALMRKLLEEKGIQIPGQK